MWKYLTLDPLKLWPYSKLREVAAILGLLCCSPWLCGGEMPQDQLEPGPRTLLCHFLHFSRCLESILF